MSIAAGSYKRILQILEKWPIDKNKAGGRDLGEYLKNYVDKAYRDNQFERDIKYWDKQYISLNILLKNEHKNKYKRTLNTSATGLTAEQCNIALSNDILEELAEEEASWAKKFFSFGKKVK